MKKVFITTLGCKVNQFESAAFKTGFEERGITVVSLSEEADLIVINTCAVTAGAGAQSRQTIRQALRHNPSAEIIITGCYAEIAEKELSG
jgi:threonylcarbamoyladenosine tRNA methylthiotransferase MtaB